MALRKCVPQKGCGRFIDITACCLTVLDNLICVVWCSAFLLHPLSEPNAPVALTSQAERKQESVTADDARQGRVHEGTPPEINNIMMDKTVFSRFEPAAT